MHTHGILLAAGQSRRFGGIKQLANINGVPMLVRAIRLYQQCRLDSFAVALGANYSEIEPTLAKDTAYHFVQKWTQGMGATLSYMVALVPAEATHILVGLADQIAVGAEAIASLQQMAEAQPNVIVAAKYKQVVGVPAIFPRRFFSDLMQLSGDQGARRLLLENRNQTVAVDMPAAAIDIDTQDDLKKWRTSHRQAD